MKFVQFWVGVGLALLLLLPFHQPQASALDPMQQWAVQLEGRKKPLDTVAREAVTQIHGSAQYRRATGEVWNAQQTYLSLWWNDHDWNDEPFILLTYRPLKAALALDVEQKYFSFRALMASGLGQIVQEAEQRQAQNEPLTRDQREALSVADRLELMATTVGNETLPLVPHPNDLKGKWIGIPETQQYYGAAAATAVTQQYEALQATYFAEQAPPAPLDQSDQLGAQAETLHQQLAALSLEIYPRDRKLQQEVFFNHFHPFRRAWVLYAVAFGIMLCALHWLPNRLYWSSIGVFSTGLLVQGYGFWLRLQIANRPPVTNMYESVVWVGFGIALLAYWFEWRTQARYYLLAAAPLSVLCLVLADSLPAVLDPSIQPLVPVLRDNFWLSVHVPTITLSYASFALATGLGHVTLGHYLFAPQAKQRIQRLTTWNYQVLQVGILLLTAGIILGGIWAHFSWGRFWGWDPKETWALIALLCYLAPLHGRLVGWIGDFGLTVASVVAFNAVLMAWYGVNFVLGTGLHSYGFGTGSSALVVAIGVGLDVLFVLVAIVGHQCGWSSLRILRGTYDNIDRSGSPDSDSPGAIASGR